MDKETMERLARCAGLDKALAQFPDDVAAAAAQAEGVAERVNGQPILPPSHGRRCASAGVSLPYPPPGAAAGSVGPGAGR